MKLVRESDSTPPSDEHPPDENNPIKPKDDPSWSQDKEGVKYNIYTDNNGQAYDPYYIVGKIFWNYYITYLSLFFHLLS